MSRNTYRFFALFGAAVFSSTAFALPVFGGVRLSVGCMDAAVGETGIQAPISLTDIGERKIDRLDLWIDYDPLVIKPVEVVRGPDMPENWILFPTGKAQFPDPIRFSMGAVVPQPISSHGGIILIVVFDVVSNVKGTSALVVVKAVGGQAGADTSDLLQDGSTIENCRFEIFERALREDGASDVDLEKGRADRAREESDLDEEEIDAHEALIRLDQELEQSGVPSADRARQGIRTLLNQEAGPGAVTDIRGSERGEDAGGRVEAEKEKSVNVFVLFWRWLVNLVRKILNVFI